MRYYALARKQVDKRKFVRAKEIFERGITHGDIKCTYGLFALKMTLGEDATNELQDLIAVLSNIKALAQKGDSEACFIVAKCYESGCCAQSNIKKAMYWYKKSATLGCLDAAYNLGGTLCYNQDFFNLTKGIEYLKFAARANHKEAQHCLWRVYERCGKKKAAAFWQKRANRGKSF